MYCIVYYGVSFNAYYGGGQSGVIGFNEQQPAVDTIASKSVIECSKPSILSSTR